MSRARGERSWADVLHLALCKDQVRFGGGSHRVPKEIFISDPQASTSLPWRWLACSQCTFWVSTSCITKQAPKSAAGFLPDEWVFLA